VVAEATSVEQGLGGFATMEGIGRTAVEGTGQTATRVGRSREDRGQIDLVENLEEASLVEVVALENHSQRMKEAMADCSDNCYDFLFHSPFLSTSPSCCSWIGSGRGLVWGRKTRSLLEG
jgi:hypothetical protein